MAGFLLVLGLLQMSADLAGWSTLKGLAAATAASPAPKVFSAVSGLETYSTRFFIDWQDRDGGEHSLELTPEVYSRLRGPYNRRNVYGAIVAYGPILATNSGTRDAFEQILRYGLCGDAPLVRELGIDPALLAAPPRVRLEPLPGTELGDFPNVFEAPCSR